MLRMILLCVAILMPISESSDAGARVLYVNGAGTPGVDCDCVTIQACVDSAGFGDTVLVAAGSYGAVVIDGTAGASNGVCLISESGPEVTVIDGADTANAVYCALVESLLIRGFTITRGSPRGVVSANAAVHIEGNLIRENSEGGIYAWGNGGWCDLRTNVLEDNGGNDAGGGIYCATPGMIEANIIQNNHACLGGGLYCGSPPLQVRDNLFVGNTATGDLVQGFWAAGAGLFAGAADVEIVSNTFVGNVGYGSGESGAQVEFRCVQGWCRSALITFNNNLVVGNPEGLGVSSISCSTIELDASCNDIWGNATGDYGTWCGDSTGTAGNFSEDPMFCDPGGNDYRINCASPCAPGNHPDGYPCGLIGAFGVSCGGSATERTTWGAVKAMYR